MYQSLVENRTDAVGFMVSVFNSKTITNELELAIEKKLKLLPNYRQQCNIIWLLITLPSTTIAGDFILPCTEFFTRHKAL